MAPVEFEKELKKRLRSREAHPSEDAWNRIADRLDATGNGRPRNSRWRMGLAAASVAFLAALVFFWQQPAPSPGTDPVVETSGEEAQVSEKHQPSPSEVVVAESEPSGIAPASEEERSGAGNPPEASEPDEFLAFGREEASAVLDEPIHMGDSDQMDRLVAQQLDTLQSSIVAIQKEKGSVSDAQVDSLLREAQLAIGGGDVPDQPSVDPALLLAQAEDELDQTFREKIMEKVKSGVTRFRTAVAQQNK